MTTHPIVEANLQTDTKRVSAAQVSEMHRRSQPPAPSHCADDLLFQAAPNLAPIAVIPQALANLQVRHKLRRIITREEGRALETIGHAVDYLNDCYLYEGDDKELIHAGGSTVEALGILISARAQILQSLPLKESRTVRIWNALFHPNFGRDSQRTV